MARMTTASSAAGTRGASSHTDGAGSFAWPHIFWMLVPSYGTRPVSIWNSTQPSE
jgi:hypothetical protein